MKHDHWLKVPNILRDKIYWPGMIKFSVLEDSDAVEVQIFSYDVQSNILDFKLLHLVEVESLQGYYTAGHMFDSNPIKEGGADQKLFSS